MQEHTASLEAELELIQTQESTFPEPESLHSVLSCNTSADAAKRGPSSPLGAVTGTHASWASPGLPGAMLFP